MEAATTAEAPVTHTVVEQTTGTTTVTERSGGLILWFLGVIAIMLVATYGALAIVCAIRPPLDSTYTIVQTTQGDLKETLLVVLGILGGVVSQQYLTHRTSS